jgi:glycosyltransferase involved in cell wall biosynthesis
VTATAMLKTTQAIRVLYSFPHKLGADRICSTAWHQVESLAKAGADVLAFPGVLHRALPENVKVRPTLAWGKLRLPYKLTGRIRALALHDYIVARRLEKLAEQVDIVHVWPVAALETIKTANRLGIPTVLERPNANTRFAYETVQKECARLGVMLPPGHEYEYNTEILEKEEEEYSRAFRLLCPSDFVLKTFVDQGYSRHKLLRHFYGVDAHLFRPNGKSSEPGMRLTMLFVGVCAVRKGVHFALEAWLRSPAHKTGKFLIAGEFLPAYRDKLAPMLRDPSVEVLGHRKDVADLMRKADILVLPSIEEGSALVTSEARASGCVLLVSDAAGAICTHMENALVHHAGDVSGLAEHITLLHKDRRLLARLRANSLRTVPTITWESSGERLVQLYRSVIEDFSMTEHTVDPLQPITVQ